MPAVVGKILFPCLAPGAQREEFGKMYPLGDGMPWPVSLIYGWVFGGQIGNASGTFWALPTGPRGAPGSGLLGPYGPVVLPGSLLLGRPVSPSGTAA